MLNKWRLDRPSGRGGRCGGRFGGTVGIRVRTCWDGDAAPRPGAVPRLYILPALCPLPPPLACWRVAPGAFTSPYGDSRVQGLFPAVLSPGSRPLPASRAFHRTPSGCLGVPIQQAKTSREQKKVKWAHLPVLFWGWLCIQKWKPLGLQRFLLAEFCSECAKSVAGCLGPGCWLPLAVSAPRPSGSSPALRLRAPRPLPS